MAMDAMGVNGVVEALNRNGFNTSPFLQVEDPSEITLDFLQDWANSHPYPTDGVVHNAVEAIKFPTEAIETEVVDVHWEQSEKGRMIPVLEIKPTELYGTTVTRVTAYHAQFIQDHKIGPGARVKVTKANEIIPYITEVVAPAEGGPKLPAVEMSFGNCQWVGVHLVVEDQEHIAKKRLLKFIKTLVDMDGLGDKNLQCIFTALKIRDVPGLLNILDSCQEFVVAQGSCTYEDLFSTGVTDHQRKIGVGVLQALMEPVDPELLLFALNLDAVGKTASRDLAPYLKQIAEDLEGSAWREAIKQNKDKAIAAIEAHRDLIAACLKTIMLEALQDLKPVVLTGTMSRKRKDMVTELKRLGFREESSVAEGCIVIAADPNGSSTKLKKARKLEVPILTEAEFFEKHGS
jgi:DNA ligase (NAD+)